MARFLLLPGNNTLSHIAKCLALRNRLQSKGHEVHVAVSENRASFMRLLDQPHHILPDLNDNDLSATPTLGWFRSQRLLTCIQAEVDLMRRLKPDRVLGVFRFTGGLSASLVGVPYDSLVCGSMTPACQEVLGFANDEPGVEEQAAALNFFRSAGANRFAPVLRQLGLGPVDDLWQLLLGEQTYLWDTPEFQPLPKQTDYHHVGPIVWSGWPYECRCSTKLDRLRSPIAFLAFGTGGVDAMLLHRLVDALLLMGYSVALALGGQAGQDWPSASENLAVFDFLPSESILPRADLVVCHGGQMLIFEALQRQLPVFVLPMQSEQAQNGRCLERLGCGQRLLRGFVFNNIRGGTEVIINSTSAEQLADTMADYLSTVSIPQRLMECARMLDRYSGEINLARILVSRV